MIQKESNIMTSLPVEIGHVGTPPIKCQGIKTKLVPFIFKNIVWNPKKDGIWIEPFFGSGVVAFNLAPKRAIIGDSNRHIIALYSAIYNGHISGDELRDYLQKEGALLQKGGVDRFYEVRERFNKSGDPFDFIFLSRSCFNGMMRFNGKGKFNVPFCHKPARFSKSYITKIVNQVNWVARQMRDKDWQFRVSDWRDTLAQASKHDFVYLDPPYIGRHTDYYNSWSEKDAKDLAKVSRRLSCGFALSMWYENKYRKNNHIHDAWAETSLRLFRHFYHVGSHESLRNEMYEALAIRRGYEALITDDDIVKNKNSTQEALRI